MRLNTAYVPERSGQPGRCHLLPIQYAPTPEVQLETVSQINGLTSPISRQDTAKVACKILRCRQLNITVTPDDGDRLRGSVLIQRPCLIHWLGWALR